MPYNGSSGVVVGLPSVSARTCVEGMMAVLKRQKPTNTTIIIFFIFSPPWLSAGMDSTDLGLNIDWNVARNMGQKIRDFHP
jgi:hypothetical protein